MRDRDDLGRVLGRLDGRGYRAYRELSGTWMLATDVVLHVDHVQGDPFAAPSRVRLSVAPGLAALPPAWYETAARAVALRDFVARRLDDAIARGVRGRRGTGRSGEVRVDTPGQEVLDTSAVVLTPGGGLEARLACGLPANGRRIAAAAAAAMLADELPALATAALRADALDADAVWRHVAAVEDARTLRARLPELGLVAFLAEGAILPRRSGIDERPLTGTGVVPLRSPDSLRVAVDLPNGGRVQGLGIPAGVTLVVGGGYHGKSTLLEAVQRGVDDHVPGDGRELVVTDPGAAKLRAEDGRRVEAVDISPFIADLPGGRTTRAFRSDDASGSTSQAASLVEALEAGATVLLMDEDTSATNFLIRDERMQALVARADEPITPLVDRVRQLHCERGVSSVLVLGGSGDYLDVADTVIALRAFVPLDVTGQARRVAREHPTARRSEAAGELAPPPPRRPLARSLDPSRGRRPVKVAAHGRRSIVFGRHEIDLAAVEQLVHPAQVRAVAEALVLVRELLATGEPSVADLLAAVAGRLDREGPDALARFEPRGDLAAFRPLELAAALNRLRTLEVRTDDDSPRPAEGGDGGNRVLRDGGGGCG